MKSRYPAYKPSGVEWIDDVPAHWEVRKLSRSYDLIGSGTTPTAGEEKYYHNGTINWINTGDLNDGLLLSCSKRVTPEALADHSTLKVYPEGSVAIALYGATIGKLAVLGIKGCTNQACCVLTDSPFFHNSYLFYWLYSNRPHIISMACGGGQPNISQELVRSLKVPCPPLQEQRIMTKYLDEKTTLIDDTIRKKQRLIGLLQDERTALINQAVTRGLDPRVPMKPSGVDWLGEIPAHWQIRKLSRSYKMIGSGTTPTAGEEKYYQDGTINWINTGDLNDGTLLYCTKKITALALSNYSTLRIYPVGSVVIALYGATIGKLSVLGIEGCTNQACCVLTDSSIFRNSFLFYWLLVNRPNIISMAYGGGQPNISQELVRSLKVPCPPLEEQQLIVDLIETKIDIIDRTIEKNFQEVKLLQEYRTALINDVVSGKCCVVPKLEVLETA